VKRFIFLGIPVIGLALILTGGQAMANDGSIVSIVSETHTAAFHTLSKMSMGAHMAPIPMTDEQLNAVEGKQNLSDVNLRQEILTSTQEIVNQQLAQTQPPQGESLRQEVSITTQEILNQNFSNMGGLIP